MSTSPPRSSARRPAARHPIRRLPALRDGETPRRLSIPAWVLPSLVGFVALTLTALLVIPTWLTIELRQLRTELEAEVGLGTTLTHELQLALARAGAGTRGFLVSGDPLFADDFLKADAEVADLLDQLTALAPELGEHVEETLPQVQAIWSSWQTPEIKLVVGPRLREHVVRDLSQHQAFYDEVLHAAEALAEAVHDAGTARHRRIQAIEQIRSNVMLTLVPLALLAAGVVLWLSLRVRAYAEALAERDTALTALTRELEQRVDARTQEVRALSEALVDAERKEQARIAQLLHDHLQQLLVGAQMRAALLPKQQGQDLPAARELNEILAEAVEATRNLAIELVPPVLHERGLGAALQWLGEHMERVHGLSVSLEIDGCVGTMRREVQLLLFQLARELLFNVVKHAHVDQARLALQRTHEALVLEVTDEGDGFEMTEATGGFGLSSIRERVALISGRFDVASAPGQGTRTWIRIPADHAFTADALAPSEAEA